MSDVPLEFAWLLGLAAWVGVCLWLHYLGAHWAVA